MTVIFPTDLPTSCERQPPDLGARGALYAAQTQLPITPPSFLRIATMPERGRPPGV